jgi:hypothetical protein
VALEVGLILYFSGAVEARLKSVSPARGDMSLLLRISGIVEKRNVGEKGA